MPPSPTFENDPPKRPDLGPAQLTARSKRCFILLTHLSEPGVCGGTPDELTTKALLSECGGLSEEEKASAIPDTRAPSDYCDAEMLHWTYDAESGVLHLLDARIVLNCCGEHDMTFERQPNGTYLIRETDVAGDAGRCRCTCVFDYQITVENLFAGGIDIEIVREVEPETEVIDVWKGHLSLDTGSGSVVIDDTGAEPWCSGGGDTDTGAACAAEGETVAVAPGAPDCCPGLNQIPVTGGPPECAALVGGVLCAACPDGTCDAPHEDVCNCPEDCD
jgi:hypothetical protein